MKTKTKTRTTTTTGIISEILDNLHVSTYGSENEQKKAYRCSSCINFALITMWKTYDKTFSTPNSLRDTEPLVFCAPSILYLADWLTVVMMRCC